MGAVIKPIAQEENNFLIYPLIWLDSSINTAEENLDGQKLIRSSIDNLKTFDNINKCQEYIESISQYERIILIVSGRLGREIVPQIHHLRQVSAIYVYCLDKPAHEQWTKEYKKVKDIAININELIDKIRLERSKRCQNEVNEPFSISIYQTTDSSNEYFIYSQLLIDILFRLKPTNTDKKKLMHSCKEIYHNIDYELKYIEEFDTFYSAQKALEWYMKDTCLYRILNQALRTQHLDLLFLFRFYLQDIRQAIERKKCTTTIRVYRSQLMTMEEINLLTDSIGSFVSIHSFLSTSTYREIALVFLNQSSSSNNLEKVLLEIYADPSNSKSRPFCFIESNNNIRQNEEVLFTLGSIFRLINITQQPDGIWLIQLVLSDQNDENLKDMFKIYQKNQEINILSFGNILIKIGQINQAEKFFHRVLAQLSNNHQDIAHCYYSLGCIAMEKQNLDLSLDYHKKSLTIKLKNLKQDNSSIIDSYNSLGQIYLKKLDYNQALASYLRALKFILKVNGENHLNVAICYTNIARLYQKQEDYIRALECHQKSLDIRKNLLPNNHPDLGITHNNIAIIYSCRSQYELALEHFNNALDILVETLSLSDPELAVTYCGLGLIHEQNGELGNALAYYEKAAVIYREVSSSTHADVIQIEKHIERILSKLS